VTSERHPVWQLLDKLQMDNRAQAAKLVELRALVAGLGLPEYEPAICPDCGTKFSSKLTRDEHLYNAHGGPIPEHYLAAERAAGLL
jgi:hypothetical protein